MSAPPGRWSDDEIQADAAEAVVAFRQLRFSEPLAAWLREVDARAADFTRLFEDHDIARPHNLTAADIPNIIEAGLLDALRYLPGPPVSADDLKNLADVRSLSPRRLRLDPEASQRLLDTIRLSVDPRRFPWLAENRDPTPSEQSAAVFASSLLHAKERLQTSRRTDAKTLQESAVRAHLVSLNFESRKLPRITNSGQFPPRGVVSTNEVQFGPERADLVARLWDDRMFPIECKSSNSEVNSYKRLNHDTLAKYHAWINAFGRANVVPAALLAGVFSPANVRAAQEAGLMIFWSHRISDITIFVEGSR